MTMDGGDRFAQAKQRLAAYGSLVGRLLASELDALRAAVKGKGKGLILMTSGPKVTAHDKDSRFGWVHFQLPPAVEDIDAVTNGEAISSEFLRAC
ncbi:hypothetical protein [Mesorhizobium sp. WSM2239]|uniref:Uncharacterized protein n=2 Tax=unclassified Mesorhizobium TaxID=325217 RepID=A0AAU8D672_9HYPH